MRFLVLLLIGWPAWGAPHFQAKLLEGKRAKKESSQWNLADWMAQKNKIAFWDHWLAMNRQATIYEFNVGASHSRFETKITDAADLVSKSDGDAQRYDLDFYITIFNLFGEYEKTNASREGYGGGIGLRIFGTSSQTTNIILKTGWRKLNDLRAGEAWENTFAEAALQFYLVKFMGLQGKYRMIFPSESEAGNTLSGTRVTGGVFFEGMIFRLFADYYQEPMRMKSSAGVITKVDREGYDAGIRLYF